MHVGKVKDGVINVQDKVIAMIDGARRLSIARNHTATHLLQSALRTVLGNHVQQQGSWVGVDRLRFDFTHFSAMKERELDRVEELVNEYVVANLPVSKRQVPLQEAREQGALAFFAEKYEDKVRVVTIGSVSKEFCGGTHLEETGYIGLFRIIRESAVASGVRRIEAATALNAYRIMKGEQDTLRVVSGLLRAPVERITLELEKRLRAARDLEKQLSNQRWQAFAANIGQLLVKATLINGVKVVMERLQDADTDMLRRAVDLIKQKENNVFIALGCGGEGRANIIVATNVATLDAAAIIKQAAPEIDGSGGGRKDFAQAGGRRPEKIEDAFEKMRKMLENALSA